MMRASEGLEIVLPALRLAFATASRLTDVRTAGPALPDGWSLTDIEACDGARSLLVSHDEDEMEFLVSEDARGLELHAIVDEELVLLAQRRTRGVLHVLRAA